MTWLDLAVATIAAGAIILLPGVGLALAFGLRGLWLWAMAAPFGISTVAIASVAAPLVGMGWSWVPVAVVFIVVALAVLVVRLLTGGLRAPVVSGVAASGPWWVSGASLIVAGAVLTVQVARVIGEPGNISQTFDNIFHLNAIRFVMDSLNASPLHLGSMTSPSGGVWFYPSAWHAWGALVAQLTGADVAIVASSLAMVSSCIFWPAGVVLLARTVFGSKPALVVSAGVFAAATPSMPLLMMDYGVLYPFQLGLALTPAALSAVAVLLRIGAVGIHRVVWIWVVAVLGTLPALALAHPGAFMAWLVFSSIAVLIAYVQFVRAAPGGRRVSIATIGFVLFVTVALVAWKVLKPAVDARSWPPTLTLGQAVGDVLMLSYWGGAIPIVTVFAVAVGLGVSIRRHRRADVWIVVGFASASILYIAAIAMPWPTLRDLLTASWYNNAPRLAAIVPIVLVPLAAQGAEWAWRRFRTWISRRSGAEGRRMIPVSVWAVGLTLVLIAATQLGAMEDEVDKAAAGYALTSDSALLSTDEMALLRRLADEVPEGATIAGSPWTGAGMAYAISGRNVLMPHTLMDVDEDTAVINDHLDEADSDSAVCRAIRDKRVQYVLDFGDREVHGAEHRFRGFEQLATSGAVEVVDREGDAVLYRIVGCS